MDSLRVVNERLGNLAIPANASARAPVSATLVVAAR
jgi:hypothetical protein